MTVILVWSDGYTYSYRLLAEDADAARATALRQPYEEDREGIISAIVIQGDAEILQSTSVTPKPLAA